MHWDEKLRNKSEHGSIVLMILIIGPYAWWTVLWWRAWKQIRSQEMTMTWAKEWLCHAQPIYRNEYWIYPGWMRSWLEAWNKKGTYQPVWPDWNAQAGIEWVLMEIFYWSCIGIVGFSTKFWLFLGGFIQCNTTKYF